MHKYWTFILRVAIIKVQTKKGVNVINHVKDLIARAIFSFCKQNENAHGQNFHLTPYQPTDKSGKNF